MSDLPIAERLRLGYDALVAKNYSDAISCFQAVLQKQAENPDALEGLAEALLNDHRFEEAVQPLQKLIQLQPLESRHYTNLGVVYLRSGQLSKAVEAIRKAIQRNRKCAQAYYNLGLAQQQLREYSLSASAYKEAVKLQDDFIEAHINLAILYMQMANYQSAMTHFRHVLSLDEAHQRAQQGMLFVQEAIQAAKAARNPFGRLVDLDRAASKGATAWMRELTDSERQFDRDRIRQIIEGWIARTHDALTHLKKQLEPAIHHLQRTAAEADQNSLAFGHAATEYQEIYRSWQETWQQFKRPALELQAHEEMINMPT
ncbi:MAG: hypothetical protein KatS3mg113_0834 [Planctomycetaceae bacterium]|nr:MAG: hypothetical protein KatS3mg113_0834 [Planctomycetaceae bacterium]